MLGRRFLDNGAEGATRQLLTSSASGPDLQVKTAFERADGGFIDTFLVAKSARMKIADRIDPQGRVQEEGEEAEQRDEEAAEAMRVKILAEADEIARRLFKIHNRDSLTATDFVKELQQWSDTQSVQRGLLLDLNAKAVERHLKNEAWHANMERLLTQAAPCPARPSATPLLPPTPAPTRRRTASHGRRGACAAREAGPGQHGAHAV